MKRSTRRSLAVLAALGVLAAGCAGPEDGSGARAADAEGAPNLVEIMQQLEADMARIGHGVWVEDFDSIAAAARAVADHPEVGPGERAEILGILGDRGAGFRQADMSVHDTAVELAERADAGDMAGVLAALSRLQQECVSCHIGYRATLQAARR
jgi:cytochrome c556